MRKTVKKAVLAAMCAALMLAGCNNISVTINDKDAGEYLEEKANQLEKSETEVAEIPESEEVLEVEEDTQTEDVKAQDEELNIAGLYRYDYESPYEDQEGVMFTDWIYFMPNHYGMMDSQDYVYFTWNEDGTIEYVDSDITEQFEYDGESDSITLLSSDEPIPDITYIRHEGAVVTPGTFVGGEYSTDDGTFGADFYGEEIEGNAEDYSMRVRIYSEDAYDIVDIGNLKEGDVIIADNCIVEVKSLDKKNDSIVINDDSEGITRITLTSPEESCCFVAEGLFGKTSSDLGAYVKKVSKDVKYTYIENGTNEYTGEEAFEKLCKTYGTQYTTKVMIAGGEICEVTTQAETFD